MRRLIVILSLLSLAGAAGAQPPTTLWTHTYGGNGEDIGISVQQTQDEGFIIAGFTTPYGVVNFDLYLIKTNINGDTLWTRKYGGSNQDYGYCIQQTQDGGYILAGSTSSFGAGDFDAYLIKTNAAGDTTWTKTYGGSNYDAAISVLQTSSGNYVAAGRTLSFGAGSYDVYLINTDGFGNIIWSRTYGGGGSDGSRNIQQTPDSGFIIAGYTQSFGAGNYDVYLIKTNAAGDTVWTRTYGGSGSDYGYSVQPTQDGGYIIAGYTQSFGAGNNDVYLIKTNAAGDTSWTRTFGGTNSDIGYSVQQTHDGGYIVAGITQSFGAGSDDVYLIKTNAAGNAVWTNTYGGNNSDYAYSVQQIQDLGYIIAGETWSFVGSAEVYLIRLAAESPLTIVLTPINPPIIIPAHGGSFNFNLSVQRMVAPQAPYTVWCRIKNPNGTYTAPTLGPISINTPVGVTVTRHRTQNVPRTWPAGLYTYLGYANDIYAYPAVDSSSFTFTKSPAGDGGATGGGGATVWEATCSGEPFPGEEVPPLSRGDRGDLVRVSASPNPFNPTTVLSFELQVPSLVSLKIYDTAGRLVQTLVDERKAAGEHQVTFDGSGLAAGIYLYTLKAGANSATGKMVLLK